MAILESALSSFQQSMQSLLKTGSYSDLTITCGGRTWKVHKALVCSQSPFFRAAIEFGGEESESGTINLPEDDPEVVGYMIDFMYNMTYNLPSDELGTICWFRIDWDNWDQAPMLYPDGKRIIDCMCWHLSNDRMDEMLANSDRLTNNSPDQKVIFVDDNYNDTIYQEIYDSYDQWKERLDQFTLPENHRDACTHAQMYSIADKYNIPALKDTAAVKFKESIEAMFSGKEFFEAVHVVFTTTPDTDTLLRNIVVEHLHNEMKLYGMHEDFDEQLHEIPDLLYFLWKYEWSLPASEAMPPGLQATTS